MVNKICLFLVLELFLTGCYLDNNLSSYTIGIVNNYYDDIYIYPDVQIYKSNYSQDNYMVNINNLSFSKIEQADIFTNPNIFSKKEQINFYLDKNHECLLFTKSNKELLDLVNTFIKSNKGIKPILLIERDGIRIVSMEEYERIKPTLKPHPFDSSLCKHKQEAD